MNSLFLLLGVYGEIKFFNMALMDIIVSVEIAIVILLVTQAVKNLLLRFGYNCIGALVTILIGFIIGLGQYGSGGITSSEMLLIFEQIMLASGFYALIKVLQRLQRLSNKNEI